MGNIVKNDALVTRPLILGSLLGLDNRVCEFCFPKASACFGCCVKKKKNSRSFPVDVDVNVFLVKIFKNARCQVEYFFQVCAETDCDKLEKMQPSPRLIFT